MANRKLTPDEIKQIYGSQRAYEEHQEYAARTDEVEREREKYRKSSRWFATNLLTFGLIPQVILGGVLLIVMAIIFSLARC